jgi:quercetin dioxygenase-like cupin family protein
VSGQRIDDLPGSERARRFIGADHGATVSFYVMSYQRGEGPDLHRHPYEETFIIQAGSAAFRIDGEEFEAHAGEIVIAPAGAAHGFKNPADEPLRAVGIHPAERMQQEDLE